MSEAGWLLGANAVVAVLPDWVLACEAASTLQRGNCAQRTVAAGILEAGLALFGAFTHSEKEMLTQPHSRHTFLYCPSWVSSSSIGSLTAHPQDRRGEDLLKVNISVLEQGLVCRDR